MRKAIATRRVCEGKVDHTAEHKAYPGTVMEEPCARNGYRLIIELKKPIMLSASGRIYPQHQICPMFWQFSPKGTRGTVKYITTAWGGGYSWVPDKEK